MKKYFLILFTMSLSFMIAQDNLDNADEKLDGAYEKVTLKEREIIQYDHLRQADIKWQKRVWRVLDFKEKMNLPFIHPKMGLVKIVHDAAKRGDLQVFTVSEDKGETFKETMSSADVNQIGYRNDTTMVIDLETGLEKPTAAITEFNPESVSGMRIKEDWLFDIESSTLLVRILGFSFLRDKTSETGEFQGVMPMYWVYYPDVRSLLAQNQVYNIKNDANTTSWEDIFEMRYFSSYIMKESNVFDRRIQSYATGLDLLYESERIHEEIRNYEHDLWEY